MAGSRYKNCPTVSRRPNNRCWTDNDHKHRQGQSVNLHHRTPAQFCQAAASPVLYHLLFMFASWRTWWRQAPPNLPLRCLEFPLLWQPKCFHFRHINGWEEELGFAISFSFFFLIDVISRNGHSRSKISFLWVLCCVCLCVCVIYLVVVQQLPQPLL